MRENILMLQIKIDLTLCLRLKLNIILQLFKFIWRNYLKFEYFILVIFFIS